MNFNVVSLITLIGILYNACGSLVLTAILFDKKLNRVDKYYSVLLNKKINYY